MVGVVIVEGFISLVEFFPDVVVNFIRVDSLSVELEVCCFVVDVAIEEEDDMEVDVFEGSDVVELEND